MLQLVPAAGSALIISSLTAQPETTPWLQALQAFLGSTLWSAIVAALVALAVDSWMRRTTRKGALESNLNGHLESLLLTVDELASRIRSLAVQDFAPLLQASENKAREVRALEIALVNYWSQLEVLRRRISSIEVSRSPIKKRLKNLHTFITCLESRHIRVLPRIEQRAIAECFMEIDGKSVITKLVSEFVLLRNGDNRNVLAPLDETINKLNTPKQRQRILKFGIVLQAMIDTMDPGHHVGKSRPAYVNKLTRNSRADLRFRTFKLYLPLVKKPNRYYDP